MRYGEGIRPDMDGYPVARGLGDAKRSYDRDIRTYDADRRCKCGARLSVYNEDDVCAPCNPQRVVGC